MKSQLQNKPQNRIRLVLLALVLLALALFTTSCIAAPAPKADAAETSSASASAEPIAIKVGTLPFLSNSILKIAQEEGYFSEQGLAVEFIVQKSSTEFIPLLVQGELDVATPALTAGFFNAVASGGNLKMVLPLTNFSVQTCASIGILARQTDVDAGTYATPTEWKGVKITPSTASVQSTSNYVLNQALAQGGLTLDDIALTIVDLPAQAQALLSGQTDLIYAIEPWITRMSADPGIALLMPAEPFAADLTSSMIVFGGKLLDNPDLGERFATAYLKAVRQYSEGKTARNVELIAAYTQLEPELVEEMCWPATSLDGAVNVESVLAYQTWLQQQNALDRLVSPDEFLDIRFAQAANKMLAEVAK